MQPLKVMWAYCLRNMLIIILMISFLLMLLPESIRELLYLDIAQIKKAHYWRLISGHFVHYSWAHWAVNAAGIIIYLLFFQRQNKPLLFFTLCFLIVFISAGLIMYSRQLTWYAGLSGVLTGLFAYSAITHFRREKLLMPIIFTGMVAYASYQLAQGELAASALYAIHTSSYAHALGLLGGTLAAIIHLTARRVRAG